MARTWTGRAGIGLLMFLIMVVTPGLTSQARGELVTVGGQAPEVTAGAWINSPPLTLAGLRGKVVLVDFWTYG